MPKDECVGTHLPPLREGHTMIDWSDPALRCSSVRVRSYTCDCVPTVYELCTAGGLAHIRRTVRWAGGKRVSESPWLPAAEAMRLWDRLLAGDAL